MTGEPTRAVSRLSIVTLGVLWALAAASPVVGADKTLRVGILSSGTVEIRGDLEQSLLQGLRDQGYVEGKNLLIERRYASSMMESMSEAARELADMKLDAIVTTCSPSKREANKATSSTTIVMMAFTYPVSQNISASLDRP